MSQVNSKKRNPLKVCFSFEHLSNDVLNLLWKKLRIEWVNKMLGQFLNPELTNVLINIIKFIYNYILNMIEYKK